MYRSAAFAASLVLSTIGYHRTCYKQSVQDTLAGTGTNGSVNAVKCSPVHELEGDIFTTFKNMALTSCGLKSLHRVLTSTVQCQSAKSSLPQEMTELKALTVLPFHRFFRVSHGFPTYMTAIERTKAQMSIARWEKIALYQMLEKTVLIQIAR